MKQLLLLQPFVCVGVILLKVRYSKSGELKVLIKKVHCNSRYTFKLFMHMKGFQNVEFSFSY